MPDFQTLLLFPGRRGPAGVRPGALGGRTYLIALGARALFRPLFFLAFIPQFVAPARGRPAVRIVALGLLFNTSGTRVNLGVAILASRATGWLRRRDREARLLQRITGGVFVALGLRLAAAGRR